MQILVPYRVTVDRRAEWSVMRDEITRAKSREMYIDQSRRTVAGGGAAELTEVDVVGKVETPAQSGRSE